MTVCYLEPDDEITGAIARLRAVKDGEAVIVVPPGSRIATSRINFKLLTREGNERRLNLVAVSDDPAVRALAIAAGLPAYDSLSAAEQALANFREQDRRLAERLGRPPVDGPGTADAAGPHADAAGKVDAAGKADATPESDAIEGTRVMTTPPAAAIQSRDRTRAIDSTRDSPARSRAKAMVEGERRKIGPTPIIAAAVLVLLLAGVGYGAYVFLPTATITLEPRTMPVTSGPVSVVADPNAAVVDVESGVVPAERVQLALTVSDEFVSTGVQAREVRANGEVRFRSENTFNEVPILEGTVVSTARGIDFETTQAAVVPRADFATATLGTVDVPVRAVRPGPAGNVPANAITELAAGLRTQLVSVHNPDPTTGGRRIEEQVVSGADYDAALAVLTEQLDAELSEQLADPANTPRGLTPFPETAALGEPTVDRSRDELLGTVAQSFMLTVRSSATVVAVNESLVNDLAEVRLRSALPAGQLLLGDDVVATHSEGTVSGRTIRYDASATADSYAAPDAVALASAVRGKSIPEARSILGAYGMVEISIWPEFVDRLPDQTARISLVLVTPSPRP